MKLRIWSLKCLNWGSYDLVKAHFHPLYFWLRSRIKDLISIPTNDDYWELNAITIKDLISIPTIDDLFDELGPARLFSKLDLHSSYHQICVHPYDIHKIVF